MYYDRNAIPITNERWVELGRDPTYRRIDGTKLLDRKNPAVSYDVTTVWLGLDHADGDGLPLIFETVVFPEGDAAEVDCTRYATERQAIEGHTQTVVCIAAELGGPIVMYITEPTSP
jgi:hypothetical protein